MDCFGFRTPQRTTPFARSFLRISSFRFLVTLNTQGSLVEKPIYREIKSRREDRVRRVRLSLTELVLYPKQRCSVQGVSISFCFLSSFFLVLHCVSYPMYDTDVGTETLAPFPPLASPLPMRTANPAPAHRLRVSKRFILGDVKLFIAFSDLVNPYLSSSSLLR